MYYISTGKSHRQYWSQLKSISQTRKQLVLQYNCKHRHPVFLLFGFIPHDVVFMFKHKRLPWCSWWPHLDLFAVTALPVCITSQAQACTISESILQLQLHHFFSSKEELWVSFYSWRLLKSCLKIIPAVLSIKVLQLFLRYILYFPVWLQMVHCTHFPSRI